MNKKQRFRYEYKAALRANAAASTARQDDLQILRNKYDFSTLGAMCQRARTIFVGPSS